MKYLKVGQATDKGYALCPQGGIFDRSYPTSTLRRARVQFADRGGGRSASLPRSQPTRPTPWPCLKTTMENKLIYIGDLGPRSMNKITHCVLSPLGIAPCIPAAMGMGGGFIPKVLVRCRKK